MEQQEVSTDVINHLYQDQIESINAFRNRQVNAIFIACATFGILSLIASLCRAFDFGLQPIHYLQVGIYIAILAMVVFRHHLSFRVRTVTLLVILFGLGIAGLLSWGLLGMGIPFIICCSVITTVLFGSRAGILVTVLGVLVVGIEGLAIILGKITFAFDMNVYAVSAGSWLTAIFGTALFTTIVVITSGRLYNSLMDSIRALSKRTASLQQINQELIKEVAKRQEIEEELRRYEEQLEEKVNLRTIELQQALANVKMLTGMLPICSGCKNIRDDEGYWHQVESYIKSHSEVEFSHGICPDCTTRLYPELAIKKMSK